MGRGMVAALAVGLLVCANPAWAQAPSVEVQPKAKLLDGGAVRVELHVTCEPFGDTGENNVTVSQDDQRISSQRSIGSLRCDGKRHKYKVVASPLEGAFHEGPANVSAFVSQINSTTSEARQGQDSQTVEVR